MWTDKYLQSILIWNKMFMCAYYSSVQFAINRWYSLSKIYFEIYYFYISFNYLNILFMWKHMDTGLDSAIR